MGELAARTGCLRGCTTLSGMCPWSCTAIVGEALSLPLRRSRLGFLRGEAEGRLRKLTPFSVPICSGNSGRLRAAPTRCGGSRELTATNKVHPLSFAFAQQLPQRWSQGALRTCGRLRAAPTGAVAVGAGGAKTGDSYLLLQIAGKAAVFSLKICGRLL